MDMITPGDGARVETLLANTDPTPLRETMTENTWNIVPVRGKIPLGVTNWQRFGLTRATVAEIKSWRTLYPLLRGTGLALTVTQVVIDIDVLSDPILAGLILAAALAIF